MQAKYYKHYMDDTDVATCARQSFDKRAENYSKQDNDNLIRYLARGMRTGDWNNLVDFCLNASDREEIEAKLRYVRRIPEHWVPFGHPHITLRMQAPVPIARQSFKHKVGYVESEESRRYITSRPELFIPKCFREAAENVKQGSAGMHPRNDFWMAKYIELGNKAIEAYEAAIADKMCPEQARFMLLQGTEVNWVWTGSLYAYANFYNQRSDAHAQLEIQDLAEEVNQIIAPLFPVSWAALTE